MSNKYTAILNLNTAGLAKKKLIFLLSLILIIIFLILIPLFLINHLPEPRNLNVILITIDALRPDHLSCYGYARKTSPNIDQVAKEGILFKQAIAQSSWTISSLPSIMTSTYPHTHRIMQFNDSLNPTLTPLPQVLKDNGYSTGAISGRPINDMKGLEKGFDLLDCNFDIKADEITKRTIKYLESKQNKKFFLWLHYFDTHGPYRPPAEYKTRYINDGSVINNAVEDASINKGSGFGKYAEYASMGNIPSYIGENNITDINYYISQYDAQISFIDDQIGILMKALGKLNIDKNTLVIITADHGEFLGEHNRYFTHADILYDQLIIIPLVIKYPDFIPKGRPINYQVQSIDIMPTILEILNIKKPKGMEGTSLFSPLRWLKLNSCHYAFSEYKDWTNMYSASIRTRDWKLIYSILDLSDCIKISLRGSLENNNYSIVESVGYYPNILEERKIWRRPDILLDSFNNNTSLKDGIDWIRFKQNTPFFLWFHRGYNKSLLRPDKIYFNDVGYYATLDESDLSYSDIEMNILIGEFKKISLNEKALILFSSEQKDLIKVSDKDVELNETSKNKLWRPIYVGTSLMPPEYELYNLKVDPYELIDSTEERRSIFKFLKYKLNNYMKQSQAPNTIVHPLNEKLKEKMRSLGYLQ